MVSTNKKTEPTNDTIDLVDGECFALYKGFWFIENLKH